MSRPFATLVFLISQFSAIVAFPQTAEPLRVNLIWTLDATADIDASQTELPSPFVRHQATCAYLAFASLLERYPDLKHTVCFSSETLVAIERYIIRLKPFIDLNANTINAEGYLKAHAGQTDAWLDMLLKPSLSLSPKELDLLLNYTKSQRFHGFAMSERTFKQFPDYAKLLPSDMRVGAIAGKQNRALMTLQDRIKIKFLYTLLHFDRSVLRGQQLKPTTKNAARKPVIDLSEYVIIYDNNTPNDESDDRYELVRPIGEDDCERLVVETCKAMIFLLNTLKNVAAPDAPDRKTSRQKMPQKIPNVELATTLAFDPMLPLLFDTDAAKSLVRLPLRFAYPVDAGLSLRLALARLKQRFGIDAKGIVPTVGAVSDESMQVYGKSNIEWILSGADVLANSLGKTSADDMLPSEHAKIYLADKKDAFESSAYFFTDVRLSRYFESLLSENKMREFAERFHQTVKSIAAAEQPVWTLMLRVDGLKEQPLNAIETVLQVLWEYQNRERVLSSSRKNVSPTTMADFNLLKEGIGKKMQTTTPSQLLLGIKSDAKKRKPLLKATTLKMIAAGSFDGVGFDKYIGDAEEQTAWTFLALVRNDLEKLGQKPPDVKVLLSDSLATDTTSTASWLRRAWLNLFATENSVWFKLYGKDDSSNTWTSDERRAMDKQFIAHLRGVYSSLSRAGVQLEPRSFAPVIEPDGRQPVQELNSAELRIDGLLEEPEWFDAAGVIAGKSEQRTSATTYYGFEGKTLFLAFNGSEIDFQDALRADNATLDLIFRYEEDQTLNIDLRKKSDTQLRWAIRDNIIELKVPFSALKIQNPLQTLNALAGQERTHEPEHYLGVALKCELNGVSRRFPNDGFYTLSEETENDVTVIFEVDLVNEVAPRGIAIDLSMRGGKAFGKLQMLDNGKAEDLKINDKVWTKAVRFKRGDVVEYKYYNGNREEFSGERRTVRVDADASTPKQMRLHDVFGRRLR